MSRLVETTSESLKRNYRRASTVIENRLTNPSILGCSINYFWIVHPDSPGNKWCEGVVATRTTADGMYRVTFPKRIGLVNTLLVPLHDPKYHCLWYRTNDNPAPNSPVRRSTGRQLTTKTNITWVQCTCDACDQWVALPVGLHRVVLNFRCSDADLWSSTKTCCKSSAGRSGLVCDKVPSMSSGSDDAPSEYVVARGRNLARNQAELEALGIGPTHGWPTRPTRSTVPTTTMGSTSPRPNVKRKPNIGTLAHAKPSRRVSKRTCRKRTYFQDEQYETQRNTVKTLYAVSMQQCDTNNHQLVLVLPDGEDFSHGPLTLSWHFVSNDHNPGPSTATVEALAGGYICLVQDHRTLHDVYWLKRSLTLLEARQQQVVVEVPSFISAGGNYRLEMGRFGRQVAVTRTFRIAPVVGQMNNDAGVWCACKHTSHLVSANYVGEWVSCSCCLAWQHSTCYSKADRESSPFECQWCRLDGRVTKRNRTQSTMNVNSDVVGGTAVVAGATTGASSSQHANPTSSISVLNTVGNAKERRRYVQIVCDMFVMMAEHLSGNYRRVHDSDIICSTPSNVSVFLGQLARGISDTNVVELGAGTGALTVNLPAGTVAYELRQERIDVAKLNAPHAVFRQAIDVLTTAYVVELVARNECFTYDLVISNPDFERGLQFVYLGLQLLSFKAHARMVFLLPSDFFVGSATRNRVYQILGCHIVHEYKLGHVGYYDNNRRKQKKTCDSIFVLRRGRVDKYTWSTTNAVGAGMV